MRNLGKNEGSYMEIMLLEYNELVDSIMNSMIQVKKDVDINIAKIAAEIENLKEEWESDFEEKDIFILYSKLRSYCNRKLFDISRDEMKNISKVLKNNKIEKIDPVEAASMSLLIYILFKAIRGGNFKQSTIDFINKEFKLIGGTEE
jgi:hypothetical protein